MIKADKGHVIMSGREDTIICEATAILHSMFEHLKELHGRESALETLANMGRFAVMSQEEMNKEALEKLMELLEEEEEQTC